MEPLALPFGRVAALVEGASGEERALRLGRNWREATPEKASSRTASATPGASKGASVRYVWIVVEADIHICKRSIAIQVEQGERTWGSMGL